MAKPIYSGIRAVVHPLGRQHRHLQGVGVHAAQEGKLGSSFLVDSGESLTVRIGPVSFRSFDSSTAYGG